MDPLHSASVLGSDGPFAAQLDGFTPRASQQDLAARIEKAIAERHTLIAESGTGTGKTFAYLVPAILSGCRAVISTGTKPLQEQLFRRDVPTVLAALDVGLNTAVLKGRANYLCRYRLEQNRGSGALDASRAARLESISSWAERTRSGDLEEYGDLGDDPHLWPLLTSTAENCLGVKCEFADSCFVHRARKKAHEADLVIVNHHLFCADLVLKEDGFGKLLPEADLVVFDEAHQLAQIASGFLGHSFSGHQLADLVRDVGAEEQREQSQVDGLLESARRVEEGSASLLQAMGPAGRRVAWGEVSDLPAFSQAMDQLTNSLSELCDQLERAAPAGEGLTRCWARSLELTDLLDRFRDAENAESVRWVETSQRSYRCHETPLDIGRALGPHLGTGRRAMIFTSATLSVAGRFDYFRSQLGLDEVDELTVDSPFDFATQALIYLPAGLPDPRQSQYTDRVVDCALPVLRASGGRAFFLFTSHRALHRAAELMRQLHEFSLLVQGEAPRSTLLERFRTRPQAVLLGTASFWEGVDVRGEALSCVIIDKLPFESPDEPVLRARLRALEERGRRPFTEYQLPNAVLALKQGTGRLIRDVHDRGVVVLCDPRLLSKGYGKVFLDSLPEMQRTRELTDVLEFFSPEALVS